MRSTLSILLLLLSFTLGKVVIVVDGESEEFCTAADTSKKCFIQDRNFEFKQTMVITVYKDEELDADFELTMQKCKISFIGKIENTDVIQIQISCLLILYN